MPTLTIHRESNSNTQSIANAQSDARVQSDSNLNSITTTLDFPHEQITVEELIRGYVYQQVKETCAKNANQPIPSPVVPAAEQELMLNGSPEQPAPQWQVEFEKTKDAFRKRQVFILVDGQQLSSLQDRIHIKPSTDVRFLRLTMLMGG